MGHTQSDIALSLGHQQNLEAEVREFFSNLNRNTGTYSLSDTVEELEGILTPDELDKAIAKRNLLQLKCQAEGIDFHSISCSAAQGWLEGENGKVFPK